MAEAVVGIVTLLMVVAPIVAVVWLLVMVHRISQDVARMAEGVHDLAERASRQDSAQP